MKILLHMNEQSHRQLIDHLLSGAGVDEEAAFIFARVERDKDELGLYPEDIYCIPPEGFEHRSPRYLELTDAMRVAIIRRAYTLGCSLIEVHSHPLFTAEFSRSDLNGLAEFVPHIWWRLGSRPFAAVVVAPDGFDALCWASTPTKPVSLSGINLGNRLLVPTNRTILQMESGNG